MIRVDNKSVIELVKNPINHEKSKHIKKPNTSCGYICSQRHCNHFAWEYLEDASNEK